MSKFVFGVVLAAGLCLIPSSASAGLFGHRAAAGCGCEVSCCEPAPVCCEPIPVCDPCDPCAPRGGKLRGLFGKMKARHNSCCAPAPVCCEPAPVVCCEPAPVVCCEPAPVCCEPAPVCCDAAPACGKRPGLFARLHARKHARHASCCDAAPSCGCEAAPSCGGCSSCGM
jgi:hypothetical protein